jgi:signal transduction histidine kinase
MLRNLGIRWQILSALALPVVVLGLISAQVTYEAQADMRDAKESRELAQAAGGYADLVSALQAERAASVYKLIGQAGVTPSLTDARALVDKDLAGLTTASGDASEAEQKVFGRAAAGHGRLTALRQRVDSIQPSDGTSILDPKQSKAISQVVADYSTVIAADVAGPADLAPTFADPEAGANFEHFAQLGQAGEALSHEQLVGAIAIGSHRVEVAGQRVLAADQARASDAIDAFVRQAPADQQTALTQALAAAGSSTTLDRLRTALGQAGTRRPELLPTIGEWKDAIQKPIDAVNTASASVRENGVTLAGEDYDAARTRLQLTLFGAIGITVLTLALALFLSRRISAPLRRLTLAATQIRDELPKIVETVQSDEDFDLDLPAVQTVGTNEVSRLAAAFVDVNAVTLEVARQQAKLRAGVSDMFVSVARRNQVLLSRQLSFIDQLERNEVNPDALEELFRLDHLATRMRRNAESLLVLAGIDSGRRLRDAMPLSDVLRTATSEIEHYSRVQVSPETNPMVYAHLALPVAHLLAELLENATNFSEPGSTVVALSADTEDGVRITIVDDGLGIPPEELAEFNAVLEEPPAADTLSSQRLGLLVVSRLAQRLDARVTMTAGRSRGTSVLVDLPTSLFVPSTSTGSAPVATASALSEAPAPPTAASLPAGLSAPVLEGEDTFEPVFTPQPAAESEAPVNPLRSRRREPAEPVAPVVPAVEAAPTIEAPAYTPTPLPELPPGPAQWTDPQTPAPAQWSGPESESAPAAGASLFSGFRARSATGAPAAAPVEPAEPVASADYADPLSFPATAPGVSAEEMDRWQAWAEVSSSEPEAYAGPQFEGAAASTGGWAPETVPDAPADGGWTPETASWNAGTEESPEPRWTPETASWSTAEAAEPQVWAPEGAGVGELTWGEEETYAHPVESPLAQTLSAAIDILPQRKGIRALGRGKGKKSPASAAPFTGGFDPIAPAREFALREGFGEAEGESGGLPAELTGIGAGGSGGDRSALASEALTELSRLSSYSPTTVEAAPESGLQRRTPTAVPADESGARVDSSGRARTAASVRSMLAGFKAGVERGRTSPSAHRPADLPQPRNSSTEDSNA